MDEKTQKKATEESKTQETAQGTDDPKDRDTPEGANQATSMIDDANLAAKRMEDANKEKKELLDREEELAAKRALGGRAEAGAAPVVKKETDEEYTDKFLAGEVNPLNE